MSYTRKQYAVHACHREVVCHWRSSSGMHNVNQTLLHVLFLNGRSEICAVVDQLQVA